jgi:hypothetical protein
MNDTPKSCELCGSPAEYGDFIPDAIVPGYAPSECGYRRQWLCRVHAVERRKTATSRVTAMECDAPVQRN